MELRTRYVWFLFAVFHIVYLVRQNTKPVSTPKATKVAPVKTVKKPTTTTKVTAKSKKAPAKSTKTAAARKPAAKKTSLSKVPAKTVRRSRLMSIPNLFRADVYVSVMCRPRPRPPHQSLERKLLVLKQRRLRRSVSNFVPTLLAHLRVL